MSAQITLEERYAIQAMRKQKLSIWAMTRRAWTCAVDGLTRDLAQPAPE